MQVVQLPYSLAAANKLYQLVNHFGSEVQTHEQKLFTRPIESILVPVLLFTHAQDS